MSTADSLVEQAHERDKAIDELSQENARLRAQLAGTAAQRDLYVAKLAQVEAERDEARKALHPHAVCPCKLADALIAQVQAAERELERWRHSEPIEGDFVCPDSLALTKTKKAAEGLREALEVLTLAIAEEGHPDAVMSIRVAMQSAREALAAYYALRAKTPNVR